MTDQDLTQWITETVRKHQPTRVSTIFEEADKAGFAETPVWNEFQRLVRERSLLIDSRSRITLADGE